MSEPQQPEIARARRSAVSAAAAKTPTPRTLPVGKDPAAPIPEDNLPGHHPEVEQDKPTVPPQQRARKPRRPVTRARPRRHRSSLRRQEPFAAASRLFGVTNDNSYVEVADDRLEIHFGRWSLTTPLSNVETAEVTGPFQWWKVIGPPHLSLKDRGITFATSSGPGVCLRFRDPVAALEPGGIIRHPGATVTVEDPEELVRVINDATAADD